MQTTTEETYAVELLAITKAFPGVVANDDVSLALRRGEVHCLLGENGAGKSTLMAILAGMQQPDAGVIRVDGKGVRIDSPRAALKFGIGTVYQHSTLIGALSVIQNLMLGDSRRIRLDVAAARDQLSEFGSMLGVEIDPGRTRRRPRAGAPAAGRDHQGVMEGIAGPDPRRADLDAHSTGRRRAAERARATQACRPRDRVHHAQASRGGRARRSDLDPATGPGDRDDRPRGRSLELTRAA